MALPGSKQEFTSPFGRDHAMRCQGCRAPREYGQLQYVALKIPIDFAKVPHFLHAFIVISQNAIPGKAAGGMLQHSTAIAVLEKKNLNSVV